MPGKTVHFFFPSLELATLGGVMWKDWGEEHTELERLLCFLCCGFGRRVHSSEPPFLHLKNQNVNIHWPPWKVVTFLSLVFASWNARWYKVRLFPWVHLLLVLFPSPRRWPLSPDQPAVAAPFNLVHRPCPDVPSPVCLNVWYPQTAGTGWLFQNIFAQLSPEIKSWIISLEWVKSAPSWVLYTYYSLLRYTLETILTLNLFYQSLSKASQSNSWSPLPLPISLPLTFLDWWIYFSFHYGKVQTGRERKNSTMKSHIPSTQLQQLPVYGPSCLICIFYFLFTVGFFLDSCKPSCHFIYKYFSMYVSKMIKAPYKNIIAMQWSHLKHFK